MRSSIVIFKSIAHKDMAKSFVLHRFHDIKYFEVIILFYLILEFIINMRASLQNL